jgi:tRNA (cmo5U34)-methyltransferase
MVGVGSMSDYAWNPETYLAQMLEEIPGYAELEDAVAAATGALELRRVLELGTGTGETAVRILAQHPAAAWVGIDGSDAMLARARERLPRADLRTARLEHPLPEGPFDLVVSVLAVHHLDGEAKRNLFTRVAQLSDTFVMGDVVVPERPEDAVIEIDGIYDVPSSVAEQVAWLGEAGFADVEVSEIRPDLAVVVARRRRP